ncbi:substrate-binding periplasmic protein [Pseudomonas saliphila]|uniref:substrate-binding periplasmic protein n=1 Tax=Pseudomonas saliphila TaxID=2586906 RepID=UPI00123BE064|nr:transporter substrate-binding domain-containing protein [Pseudomonas saliphila]
MKRLARSSLAALVLLGTAQAHAAEGACERIVVTGNPQYPPVLWVDPENEDKLIGAGVELLELALEGTGITVEVMNTGPWSRAQEEVRSGRADMLAGAFLTPERLTYMDYIHPSYVEIPSVLFVRKGQAFPYGGWDDLQSKRGSTLVNNSFGSAFDTYAKDHLDIEQVPSVEQSFRLLLSDRVDYVVYERYQGLAIAEGLGITDELDVLEGSLINEDLYYTVSHNSACNSPALRSALALGMHKVVSQGEPRRLLEKYREQWASQFMPEARKGAPEVSE